MIPDRYSRLCIAKGLVNKMESWLLMMDKDVSSCKQVRTIKLVNRLFIEKLYSFNLLAFSFI